MALDPDDPIDAIALAWIRERPQTPIHSIPIVTRIWQAAKLFGDDRMRLLREHGTDSATLDLLSTLRRAGTPYRLSTRELADQALITAGAISQRVSRAEGQGLVTRHADPKVARRVEVQLTELGHHTVEQLVDTVLHRENQLLSGLTVDERNQLQHLTRRLLEELHATLDHDHKPGHVGD
ncbi:DNA-binding MarR family transcriptional regulator [Williamsia limnetica]|jgi:DNA-binding MarR family transcriptional regulator|uniref:DNA-binding MarR family transcriptional regulator n=1 Tax=Williamsia limnetica TaxID=882452 RepID=A0A318S7T0_WILLI|nr:MarR family transcriptional regulator [Williamsia limnetica]PYE20834.1 DNA-binding MarR family transcriptional regulator [Williamsia limnetica]